MSCDSNSNKTDFEFYRGDTIQFTVAWTDTDSNPIDVTGFSAIWQVRSRPGAPDPADLEASTTNGEIVIDGISGKFIVTVPASKTGASLDYFHAGSHDLQVTSPTSVVTTLIRGGVSFVQDVTR